MLKIWKQTWKKGSDAQGIPSSGSSCGTVAVASPSTSEINLGPVLPRGRRGNTKRARASNLEELSLDIDSDRPRKRIKYADEDEETSLVKDTLGNHLPEVVATDEVVQLETPPMHRENFQEELLHEAKVANIIAVLTSTHATSKVVADYLTWAVDLECSLSESKSPHFRRTALLVTNDVPSIKVRSFGLLSDCNLAIGVCAEHISDASEWLNMSHNDVVIVSANLLLESLLAGTVHMSQIHSLVFSDVQNVKDQETHPVIKIMNHFYQASDALSRPRIFAMAVSSAGGTFHFDSGMLKLENALDAKVFSISDEKRAEILALPDRPSEVVVLYGPPLRVAETRLFKELLQFDPEESLFRHQFKAARHALVEVGSCASDLVWRRDLKEIEASVSTIYEEDEDAQGQSSTPSDKTRSSIRDTVKNWVFTMPNLDPSSRGFNVTPKFAKLVQVLKSFKVYGDNFRGIIFVQKRVITFAILDIIRTLDDGLGFLRPYALVGQGKSANTQYQQGIFQSFSKGTYNLLIATKSAEDLDIPKASVVIRYDLFESQVSDAFVRARTRGRESHLVFMLERGNDAQRRILADCTQLGVEMQEWTERLSHQRGSSVPPRDLHETVNPYHSDSEDDESGECIKDPTTSGRIYLQDAITVIYRLVANLGTICHEEPDAPLFEFEESRLASSASPSYICTVVFPPGLPVPKVSGPSCQTIAQARRAACYQACTKLFNLNCLDYRLFPLPTRITSLRETSTDSPDLMESHGIDEDANFRDSNVGIKALGTHCYLRKKPDFWNQVDAMTCGRLYPTVISTNHSDDLSQPHSPILILTRNPLPPLPSFTLFFSGIPGTVHFTHGASFEVGDDRLKDLHLYTMRICRAIANKPFVCSLKKIQYFFAPLGPTWETPLDSSPQDGNYPNVTSHIPWDLVALAANSWVVPLASMSPQGITKDVEDAVIQDRWVEFTRRYDVVRMRPDLTPMSKPLDSPRESNYDNLVEYCKARRKGFEGLKNYNQPLLEVSKVPAVLNHLNPTSKSIASSVKAPAKYLIPELCAKFTIPSSTLRTALLLPSITRRIDDFLLVKELNAKFFGHTIIEHHLHAAISAPAAGIEFDYERLELLGDAFLKYLSSIYVFVTNPAQKEGTLHIHRQRIISNKSLLQNASRIGLPQYIQGKPFSFKSWQPPNFNVIPNVPYNYEHPSYVGTESLGGDVMMPLAGGMEAEMESGKKTPGFNNPQASSSANRTDVELLEESTFSEKSKSKKNSRKKRQSDDQNTQWLGDKAVADVAEAIIGAAYISGGREMALKVTKSLNIPIPNVDRWSDFARKALAPPPNVTAKLRPGSIEAVESIIGHKFSRPHLLAQALTHASIQGHDTTSYERLEFIGDAILDFMVIRHIFDRDTKLSPGGLTLLKGAMVSNSTLAAVCVWSGLQEHLLFESYILAGSIQAYADELKLKQAKEYELAKKENRSPGQYWLEIEPPKALSDVVESIVGAIYISEDFSPAGVEAIFDNVLKPFYDRHVTLKTLSHHPTKILFELFQAQGCQQFEIVKEKDEDQQITRCDVVVHDVVLARALDTTSAFAARRASEFALDALEGDDGFLTRTCDCRTHSQARKAQKKALNQFLSGFGDEDDVNDLLAVGDVLPKHRKPKPGSSRNSTDEPLDSQ